MVKKLHHFSATFCFAFFTFALSHESQIVPKNPTQDLFAAIECCDLCAVKKALQEGALIDDRRASDGHSPRTLITAYYRYRSSFSRFLDNFLMLSTFLHSNAAHSTDLIRINDCLKEIPCAEEIYPGKWFELGLIGCTSGFDWDNNEHHDCPRWRNLITKPFLYLARLRIVLFICSEPDTCSLRSVSLWLIKNSCIAAVLYLFHQKNKKDWQEIYDVIMKSQQQQVASF